MRLIMTYNNTTANCNGHCSSCADKASCTTKSKKMIMPPVYFIVLSVISIALNFIFPIKEIIYAPFSYLGIIVIGFGIAMNLWTHAIYKKRNTTVLPSGSPTSLVTSGPFRISRNPMYLGMTAMLLGIAIFLGSLVTFVFPLIFIVIIQTKFIPMEEKNLERIFGKEYGDYKRKVRRWV